MKTSVPDAMQGPHSRSSQLFLLLIDVVLLNAAFFAAAALRFQDIPLQGTVYYDYYVQLWVFLNLLWLLLSVVFKTYNTGITLEPRRSLSKTLQVFFLHLFLLLLLLFSLKKGEYSRLFLTYFYLLAALSILPWHFYYIRLLRKMRRGHRYRRRVVLIGEAGRLSRFARAVERKPELGLHIAAAFCDEPLPGALATFPERALNSYLEEQAVDEIYAALPAGDERFQELFYEAEQRMIRFRAIPDLGLRHGKNIEIQFIDDVPVLSLRSEPLELAHNKVLKRATDLVGASLGLLLIASWLLPILAIGVRLSSPGPAFFRQQRSGYRNRPFAMYKLRSMVPNEEADRRQAATDDERITGFGRWLRRFHLDELPQLWNVLRGEMTLVGPRPHMLEHTDQYRRLIQEYMVRHWVKPGITGLAQVRGLSGAHNLDEMRQRVKTDVYYLENWSFLLDISILFQTITHHQPKGGCGTV